MLEGGDWLWPRHVPAALTPELTLTYCIGDWMDSRAGLNGCEKSHPTGVRSLDPPSRSESLYGLSYPNSPSSTDVGILFLLMSYHHHHDDYQHHLHPSSSSSLSSSFYPVSPFSPSMSRCKILYETCDPNLNEVALVPDSSQSNPDQFIFQPRDL
jgi:hypothetical protein